MASHQEEGVVPTGEALPMAGPLVNPPERTPTTLSYRVFNQLRAQFGIVEADAILPGPNDFADSPPFGFVAVNRQMCLCGAILLSTVFSNKSFADWLFLLFNCTPTATPF